MLRMNTTGIFEQYARCVALDISVLDATGVQSAITDVLACPTFVVKVTFDDLVKLFEQSGP